MAQGFALLKVGLALLAALFAAGCGPATPRLRAPRDSARAEEVHPRLDPDVMANYLAAEQLLATDPGGEGADDRALQAIERLKDALALRPDEPELWQALAHAHAGASDYEAAAAAARQAVTLAPDDGASRYLLGELLQRLGRLAEAEPHLAVAADQGLPGGEPHLPHYYLYFVRKETGDVDGALAALERWWTLLPEEAYPRVLAARLLQDVGRIPEARDIALQALRQTPSSEESLGVYLDSFRIDAGPAARWLPSDGVDLPLAATGLESVLHVDWSQPRLHRALMDLYERIGRYDRAAEHLRFVRILGTELAGPLEREQIDLVDRQHRHGEARRLLERALARDALESPEHAELLLLLATSHAREGDTDAALAVLDGISVESPAYAQAERRRAHLLFEAGWFARAASEALAAESRVPVADTETRAQLLDVAARARIALGDRAATAVIIESTERLDGDAALDLRVELLVAVDDRALAATLLRERLAREPTDLARRAVLARVLARGGDLEGAVRLLLEAARTAEERGAASAIGATPTRARELAASTERQLVFLGNQRGALLEEAGDVQGAIAAFREVLALRPSDPEAMNTLGYVLADRGLELDEAEVLLEAAFAQRAFSGAVSDSVGWLRFRQGRLEEAREAVLRAARWAPGSPEILLHLGEIEAAAGRSTPARKAYEAALAAAARAPSASERIRSLIEARLRSLGAQGARPRGR